MFSWHTVGLRISSCVNIACSAAFSLLYRSGAPLGCVILLYILQQRCLCMFVICCCTCMISSEVQVFMLTLGCPKHPDSWTSCWF